MSNLEELKKDMEQKRKTANAAYDAYAAYAAYNDYDSAAYAAYAAYNDAYAVAYVAYAVAYEKYEAAPATSSDVTISREYPDEALQKEWYAEFQKIPRRSLNFSLFDYADYVIKKAIDWNIKAALEQA